MEEPIEVVMKDGILVFDGHVLEFFPATSSGSSRHHIKHLQGIGLAKGLTGVKLKIQYATGLQENLRIDKQHRPALEELVQAVWAAHD
jgi:hypothetical protein